MIPRHRPPFGLLGLLRLLAPPYRGSVEQVEEFCARTLSVPFVVLLPSARAGICWALRAAIAQRTPVIGPAYTCHAVHEAIARSGTLRLVDAGGDFLMEPWTEMARQAGRYALVLSEIYGYSYPASQGEDSRSVPPVIRILDMAMSLPVADKFEQMHENDFAVASFGLGKCLYAGWGGLGITRSAQLASEVRRQRSVYVRAGSAALAARRAAEVSTRALAHWRVLYGTAQMFRGPEHPPQTLPDASSPDAGLSREWTVASTPVDRRLVCRNLNSIGLIGQRRKALAARYQRNLSGVSNLAVPVASTCALSHFTVRVPAASRDTVRAALKGHGIDTGRLFRFPGYLSEREFPNAARISSEVINLPLDPGLSDADVDRICACLRQQVSAADESFHPRAVRTVGG